MSNHQRSLGLKISNEAQKQFVLLEFGLLLFTMIFLLYLIFGTVSDVVGKIDSAQRGGFEAIFDQVNFLLLVKISILFVVVFIVNVLFGLFFLHRLIGPLVRIRTVLDRIAQGDIPDHDVTLRKGDFPTDVAESLSQALKRIREYKSS
jgi:hypothetical protein